jgi:hypothetical protein
MAVPEADQIWVGRVTVPLATAAQWVAEYTSPDNISSKNPYAYPAYDSFDAERSDPHRLTDADLLAPALLNVPVKLRSYYALMRARPTLERALTDRSLESPLSDVPADRAADIARTLYSVLDRPGEKPWGVNATTLSKILHRKRPHFFVLHDIWVNACYVSEEGPVRVAKSRSWADYMAAITLAIRDDLISQPEQFKVLDAAANNPGELSAVRLLDIVAWTSKGRVRAG